MQKIAVLGGTFNPVHWGHLLMAEAASTQLKLSEIIWVPMYAPPHKLSSNLLAFQHRVRMVEQAIAPYPDFTISTVEASRCVSSYAIEILSDLQLDRPDTDWFWIVGLDAFQSLPRWYRRRELAEQCCWLVAPRLSHDGSVASNQRTLVYSAKLEKPVLLQDESFKDGIKVADVHLPEPDLLQLNQQCEAVVERMASQSIPVRWQLLKMPLVHISSSLIRQYCSDRRSIHGLVPETVETYIRTHHLYQNQKDQKPEPE